LRILRYALAFSPLMMSAAFADTPDFPIANTEAGNYLAASIASA
jgi:hypothetical protein